MSAEKMTVAPQLLDQANEWQLQDPDPETSFDLARDIAAAEHGDAAAIEALHSGFDARLEFGTAGLRGELGYGPGRMNRVLVSQAAAGFASYLIEVAGDEQPSVIVGYDGRHNSEIFARDTCELMAAAGVRALFMPRMCPTPVTAYALRHLQLSAAIMVTASHNPARDNGYKVYLGGEDAGSQIISPKDAQIAAHITRVATEFKLADLPRSDAYEIAPESVFDDYVTETAAIAPGGPRTIDFVYTAMHGVGWETAARVFAAAGFPTPTVVAQQIEPDPDFPTVPFPNPEEKGAMDLSFDLAARTGVPLVIANDPDADRLAVGIPSGAGWRRLTGNEVGSLLGLHAARHHSPDSPGTLACSLVSSPLLSQIAKTYGLDYTETLTGFKYVNRVPNLIFGYEEALGYLVDPDLVRDKDGISAAVEFLALVAELQRDGKTIQDALDDLVSRYGCYSSGQVSVRVDDLSLIGEFMTKLRTNLPTSFAGVPVVKSDDLSGGVGDWPPADVLRFWLEDRSRVIFRPSGTEPKLKVYLDVVAADGSVAERIATANDKLEALKKDVSALV